jgi:hypothetical protein
LPRIGGGLAVGVSRDKFASSKDQQLPVMGLGGGGGGVVGGNPME